MRSVFFSFILFTGSLFFPFARYPADISGSDHSNHPNKISGKNDSLQGQQWKFGIPGRIRSGVNIHFITGHEKDLDMITDAGIKYVRMDFIWEKTEKSEGIYDWSEYEILTRNLEKRGIKALYILDYSNPLYEQRVEYRDPLTGEESMGIASPRRQESIKAYATWSAAAVEHFRDYNIIWEIWNEPNVSFWRPEPDIVQYTTLAMAAARAIRKNVPEAVLIGPATSKIPLEFLRSFFRSGILEYLDGVSVHPYRDYSLSPETAAVEYALARKLITHYAPEGKKHIPVISSEWGYASATKGVSVQKQAEFCIRMQLSNLLEGIPVSIWYDWKNDGENPSNFEHNCGTVTYGLEPKPAYRALRTLNSYFEAYTLQERIDMDNENDYLLVFKNERGHYRMAGWTLGPDHPVILKQTFEDFDVLDAVDGYGNELKLKSEAGKPVLELKSLPSYFEWSKK